MTITNEPEGPKPICPICRGKMEYRTPTKNMGRQWVPFWSCLRFPACEGRIEAPEPKTPEPPHAE